MTPLLSEASLPGVTRKVCADAFGLTVEELMSRSRERAVCWPRQATAYVLRRRFPRLSYPRIAALVGVGDHSTAIHAVRQTEERIKRDPVLAATVRALISGHLPVQQDAHVAAWQFHRAGERQAQIEAAKAAERAAMVERLATYFAEKDAPNEAALMALKGPPKVWCAQCDKSVPLSAAAACRSAFCRVGTQVAA